ncbi:MAG: hypothetical protein KAG61_01085 [Bacteriovoracaceae bacterium]|nr:hypothetical protein [Bacteriovoracaceae bacterium]
MRKERDFLGEFEVKEDALYGVHSMRARSNFPDESPFTKEWYCAMGAVKQACFQTYRRFVKKLDARYQLEELSIPIIEDAKIDALITAASEVYRGEHFEHFIVPAISGGAGTSINMNVNEIIANRALIIMGRKPGDYDFIDPIEHANIFQSTNDVVPTALKVAIMKLLGELEVTINAARFKIEEYERKFRDTLRIGYTQMQEAVPSSYGKLFGTYQEALTRDWWRVSKCFERIKVVNLGGSAIGTGITVPKFFIFGVTDELRNIVGLPITKSENLEDTTCNLDAFVEVHAIMKSHAVNLEKMASDLRMISSDMYAHRRLKIPARQVGSSIMPGKINPVIPEYIISMASKVYANDSIISSLSARGMLDLNAYTPIIGHSILDSLKLLIGSNNTMLKNLLEGIELDTNVSDSLREQFHSFASLSTALVPYVGYNKAAELAKEMKRSRRTIFEVNTEMKLIPESTLRDLMRSTNLLRLGFKFSDIVDELEKGKEDA